MTEPRRLCANCRSNTICKIYSRLLSLIDHQLFHSGIRAYVKPDPNKFGIYVSDIAKICNQYQEGEPFQIVDINEGLVSEDG